ncbi:MAG TPA: rod shape-determining protein MreB [Polyangia bacterium]
MAVGNEARGAALSGQVTVVNPFAHPRSVLSDFTLADQVLKAFLRRLPPSSFFRLSPTFVIHPIGEFEGGLTQIELHAMRELGLGAGATEVILWQGPALTDEQLLNQAYPTNGKVLSE